MNLSWLRAFCRLRYKRVFDPLFCFICTWYNNMEAVENRFKARSLKPTANSRLTESCRLLAKQNVFYPNYVGQDERGFVWTFSGA